MTNKALIPVVLALAVLVGAPPDVEAAGAAMAAVAGGGSEPAAAPELPAELTKEQASDLVARLSDDQVRALLLAQLEKVAVAGDESTEAVGAMDRLVLGLEEIRKVVKVTVEDVDLLPELPTTIWGAFTSQGTVSGTRLVVEFLIFLALAWGAEKVFRRYASAVEQMVEEGAALGAAARCGMGFVRALMDLAAIVVFGVVVVGLVLVLGSGGEPARVLFGKVLQIVIIVRLLSLVSRMVLAPYRPELRVPPVPDALARIVHHRVLVFVAVVAFNNAVESLLEEYSVDPEVRLMVAVVLSFVTIGVLMWFVLEARRPVAGIILDTNVGPTGSSRLLQSLAGSWHVLAIAYIVAVWFLVVGTEIATGNNMLWPAMASIAILVAIPLADLGLQRLVARYLVPEPEPAQAEATGEVGAPVEGATAEEAPPHVSPAKRREHVGVVLRNLRILMLLVVVVVFAGLWDMELLVLVEQLVGATVAGALVEIVLMVFLAYAIWGVVRIAIERRMAPEKEEDADAGPVHGGEIGGAGATRLETLLPLFRRFIQVTLVLMVVMMGLSALGVNIGPLIAGAGVIGLAIGFGAQTLVKDIVSGLFFLMDDAFRKGEYVEIGGTRGVVEKISVRSLQLRHHNGPVHTMPFGEIQTLTNYSRDWAIMKFEIRLPFETNIEKVRKIIKNVGAEMMEDPELSKNLLEPLKSQGVNRMDDSALIIRCKFTAKPGEQFVLRREAYTRIQQALAENGIHFAPRRVIVETAPASVPQGQAPMSPSAAAALAAAAGAGAMDGPEDEQQGSGSMQSDMG